MKPDEQSDRRVGASQVPARPLLTTTPSRDSQHQRSADQQNAAAHIVRSQIDTIYDDSAQHATPSNDTPQNDHPSSGDDASSPPSQPLGAIAYTSPYRRTHDEHVDPQVEQWKQYHSAWQTYYQKYYEGYYTHHINKLKDSLTETQQKTHNEEVPSTKQTLPVKPTDPSSAVRELRKELRTKVTTTAQSARKSKHFAPIVSSIVVVLLFVFFQYNQIIFGTVKAYVSPGVIDAQNLVVDPTISLTVGPEPRLIIPKINVDAPAVYDIATDPETQKIAMRDGVAHFPIPGANSHPGEIGNTVLSGHSSNDVFAPGDYKYIFAQLHKVVEGDTIYAHYNSVRYTYVVTRTEVVWPNEVSKLVYPTDKPVMTLITCTPIGTGKQRLLVTAEQVSPDPSSASQAPESTEEPGATSIPSQGEPSFLEQLFR